MPSIGNPAANFQQLAWILVQTKEAHTKSTQPVAGSVVNAGYPDAIEQYYQSLIVEGVHWEQLKVEESLEAHYGRQSIRIQKFGGKELGLFRTRQTPYIHR